MAHRAAAVVRGEAIVRRDLDVASTKLRIAEDALEIRSATSAG
jgi:hypothetical protein